MQDGDDAAGAGPTAASDDHGAELAAARARVAQLERELAELQTQRREAEAQAALERDASRDVTARFARQRRYARIVLGVMSSSTLILFVQTSIFLRFALVAVVWTACVAALQALSRCPACRGLATYTGKYCPNCRVQVVLPSSRRVAPLARPQEPQVAHALALASDERPRAPPAGHDEGTRPLGVRRRNRRRRPARHVEPQQRRGPANRIGDEHVIPIFEHRGAVGRAAGVEPAERAAQGGRTSKSRRSASRRRASNHRRESRATHRRCRPRVEVLLGERDSLRRALAGREADDAALDAPAEAPARIDARVVERSAEITPNLDEHAAPRGLPGGSARRRSVSRPPHDRRRAPPAESGEAVRSHSPPGQP